MPLTIIHRLNRLVPVFSLLTGVIIALSAFLLITVPVFAQACEDIKCEEKKDNENEYIKCISEKKSCLESKINEAQQQKITLGNTISIISGKINLQELKISQTRAELEKLEREVEELSNRIDGLNLSLDRLTSMLVERIRAQYRESRVSPFTALASTGSFSEMFAREQYVNLASQQTATAMERAELQKMVYDQEKDLKEKKQAEVELKRQELQREQNILTGQKNEQQNLLQITNNNEKRFQQLLEEAQKELAQIQSAASVVIREGNAVKIKRGETIGTMGNSGFSTGAHLHFGVYQYTISEFETTGKWGWYYNKYVNPLEKLESKSITWDTSCGNDPSGVQSSGSGDWIWPMDAVRITQSFGSNTCYNYMYGGKAHPALDIVGYGNLSVKAVADGDGYFCRNCLGDGGNGVFIFHDGGYMSLYWHLK